MFTGLVEEIGTIRSVSPKGAGVSIEVNAKKILEGIKLGDSIAIAGVCQTVVSFNNTSFKVEAVQETMKRTRFGDFRPGSIVNLERALQVSDRLGGHIVQGHVDEIVFIKDIRQLNGSWRVRLGSQNGEKFEYIVEKGSVALDGISLTVAEYKGETFDVEIIPHTWSNTALKEKKIGDKIHVEYDIIAKYVKQMLSGYKSDDGLSIAKLLQAGF